MSDYVKHLLVRTPLEKPALLFQDLLKLCRLVLHPRLFSVEVEPAGVRALSVARSATTTPLA